MDNLSLIDVNKPEKVKSALNTLIGYMNDLGTIPTITKESIGLGNVDNTSDANKPLSTLTKNYIDEKTLNKIDKVANATNGNFVAFGENGKIVDSGVSTMLVENDQQYIDNGDAETLESAKSYADNGDAETLESAKSYADESVSNLEANISNPNLLINGDFSINQRGQEEYGNTTQYSVDRWELVTQTNANLSFNATTKTLSNTGTSWGYFIQRLEPSDVDKIWGKTWTFSAKVNGNIYSKTFTAPSSAPTSSQGIAPTLICIQNLCQVRLFYYNNSGTIGFTFDIYTGSVTLEYAKLEVGSVATPFSPRPYVEELALCQRYYQKYSPNNSYSLIGTGIVFSTSAIVIGVSLPVTLRTAPTITANGKFYIKTTSATYTTNDNALTLAPAGLCNNVFQLEITSTNTSFTNGDCAVLRVSENTAYLSLDAELY